MKSWKKYLAEFFGTMVLVTFACGVAVATRCDGVRLTALIATAVAFGLVIVAMAYSIGNISGCHINPAVSFAMLLSKKMSGKDFIGYVIAQFLGAIAGAAILGIFFGFDSAPDANGVVYNAFGSNALVGSSMMGLAIAKSVIAEIILTGVFVFTILGVTSKDEYGRVSGLVIGGSLTLVHLLGIGLTGTSVNPARSFGPALLAALCGNTSYIKVYWVFLVAPMVGAALAALLWKILAPAKKAKK